MRTTRNLLALVLCATLLAYSQGNTFDKIRYNGGTVETKVGPKDWGNRLTVTQTEITLALKDGQILRIDPKRVHGLSYGQEAHRRVGTMVALGILVAPLALFGLFHKTRLHFVGIEYTTVDGKNAGLLMQAHKNNFRAVLMALRGATSAPVAVSEEDRKYVPTGVETVLSNREEGPETKVSAGESSPEATGDSDTQTGICFVESTPAAAELWVDGAFVGNTPAKLNLSGGPHKIRLSLEGFLDWEREILVIEGSEVSLNAILKPR